MEECVFEYTLILNADSTKTHSSRVTFLALLLVEFGRVMSVVGSLIKYFIVVICFQTVCL